MDPREPEPTARAVLTALSDLVSGREEEAHAALQVGGYLPLDPDCPVEIPLALCYAARAVLERDAERRRHLARESAEPVHDSPRIATSRASAHRIG